MAVAHPHIDFNGVPSFLTHDPPTGHLGSGAGTVHAVRQYAIAHGFDPDKIFDLTEPIVVLHAGGQSRRLPAYAVTGKLFIPIPGEQYPPRLLVHQHLDALHQVVAAAPQGGLVIAAGDILVSPDQIPRELPPADVVVFTMQTDSKTATGFGVCIHDSQGHVETFLQKPSEADIADKSFTVDSGLWILSPRAAKLLARKSIEDGQFLRYELYSEFGLSLGRKPHRPDPDFDGLSFRVIVVPDKFRHLGTNRHLLNDFAPQCIQRSLHQETEVEPNRRVWIDSCELTGQWKFDGDNIVTGILPEFKDHKLCEGICIDCVTLVNGSTSLRPYHVDDLFRGTCLTATFLGQHLSDWLSERNLTLHDVGTSESVDIQDIPLFPALGEGDPNELLDFMLTGSEAGRKQFLSNTRYSATQLQQKASPSAMLARSDALARDAWNEEHFSNELVEITDFAWLTEDPEMKVVLGAKPIPSNPLAEATVLAATDRSDNARDRLRDALLADGNYRVNPQPTTGNEVIRVSSPVRLDMAGAWTDTPPYCLKYGGNVLNTAITLRGVAPVEAFLRRISEPEIRLSSIDLAQTTSINSLNELRAPRDFEPEFALARTAIRLAGFDPDFHESGMSIEEQLRMLGGGFALTFVAQTPAGSGLGTSSILACAILSVLSQAFQLGWDPHELSRRTLALEQIHGSGGGWQDQIGALIPGTKLIKTNPGLEQTFTYRTFSSAVLEREIDSGRLMLFNTGMTRTAFSVLGSIVQGMFVNDSRVESTLGRISRNADFMAHALDTNDFESFGLCLNNSWELKCELDSGTDPQLVRDIISSIKNLQLGSCLLGAGGGGFLLIASKSATAGEEIRHRLNDLSIPGAGFIPFNICHRGMSPI